MFALYLLSFSITSRLYDVVTFNLLSVYHLYFLPEVLHVFEVVIFKCHITSSSPKMFFKIYPGNAGQNSSNQTCFVIALIFQCLVTLDFSESVITLVNTIEFVAEWCLQKTETNTWHSPLFNGPSSKTHGS